MLFAAISGFEWVQIIGAIAAGVVMVINAYYAKRADTKIDQAARISANTAKVVVEKLDDAALKVVDSKIDKKSLLDTQTQKQIEDIHTATNGEMTKRFDRIERTVQEGFAKGGSRMDRIEASIAELARSKV